MVGRATETGLRVPASVLIKRLLTTSFLVRASNIYNAEFPETHKYFKKLTVKPGHIALSLHQSAFNFQVQVSKQTAERFNPLSYSDLTNSESKHSPKQKFKLAT